MLVEDFHGIATGKENDAGQRIIQGYPQGVDIRADINFFVSKDVLRRNKSRRSPELMGKGQRIFFPLLGQAEVDQLGDAVFLNEDVGRFDIAVPVTYRVR